MHDRMPGQCLPGCGITEEAYLGCMGFGSQGVPGDRKHCDCYEGYPE